MFSTIRSLKENLKSPDASFRSAPFWGWNSNQNETELKNQIRDMKDKGMGGFFIHSREGLETPYLSEEWFLDVDTSIACARSEGLECWIYDEDKWPSGAAGGKVSSMDPEHFTAKGLVMVREPDGSIDFKVRPAHKSEWYNGMAPTDMLNKAATMEFIRLTHEEYEKHFSEEFGKTVKGFFTDEPNCYDFFTGLEEEGPFLPWTDKFPEYFEMKRGYSIEPHLSDLFIKNNGCEKTRHDYWRTITELFSESYLKPIYEWCEERGLETTGHILYENDLGYNIRVCGGAMPQYRYLHRPGIDLLGEQTEEYLTVKQCTSVAHQYGRENTISETYGATGWDFDFAGQKWLGDWQFVMGITRRCQHLMLYSVTGCRKRDYPPVFNYQAPWWNYNNAMEDYFARVSSCVRTGEVVRDILVLHPISSLWTMTGSDPKEDLNNIEMNMGWLDEHITAVNEIGNEYNRLAHMLMSIHRDFDFGDETILAEKGHVEGSKIIVGEASYSAVIVPRVLSLFRSTLKLLTDFAEGGGTIIWVGDAPCMLEGDGSDKARKELGEYLDSIFFYRPDDRENSGLSSGMNGNDNASDKSGRRNVCNIDGYDEIPAALDNNLVRSISVKSPNGYEESEIFTMLRKTSDGYIIYGVNHDRNNSHTGIFKLPVAGRVTAYDPWNDKEYDIETVSRPGQGKTGHAGVLSEQEGISFADTLAPMESRIYFVMTCGTTENDRMACNLTEKTNATADDASCENIKDVLTGGLKLPYVHPHYTDPAWANLGPGVAITRSEENALTIDRCSYKLDGDAEWSEEMEIWQAQRQMRERLGLPQIYYNGAPQRYTWLDKYRDFAPVPFELKLTFEVDASFFEDPSDGGARYLAMEKSRDFYMELNGRACGITDKWFLDKEINCFLLPDFAEGRNELVIKGLYKPETELEDMYLLGDFGVSAERKIIREMHRVHFGDLTLQGYFNYGGNVSYHFDLPDYDRDGRIILRMGEYAGTLLDIRVNGKCAGLIYGRAGSELDITEYLDSHGNILDIVLVGSRRNLCGPFHASYTGCSRISWADFRTEGLFHTDDYVTKPFGLMGQIALIKK